MSSIRLRPDELDLIARLINRRDSAHLSGHTSDPFQVVSLNGGASILAFPGRTGREEVPTMTVDRLMNVGLFQVFSRKRNVTTFDLADDIRDRLEQLKAEAGRPSLLAQERNARARAEDHQSHLERTLESGARERQERRLAFGLRIGRLVRWLTIAGLVVLYVGATVLGSVLTGSAWVIGAAVGIGLVIGILDWVFHIDAHRAVGWVEGRAADRATRWAEQFEADDEAS